MPDLLLEGINSWRFGVFPPQGGSIWGVRQLPEPCTHEDGRTHFETHTERR